MSGSLFAKLEPDVPLTSIQEHIGARPRSPSDNTDDSSLKDRTDFATTSLKVFRSFIKSSFDGVGRSRTALDVTGVISKECFQAWVASRRCELKHPEKAFQRTLSAHLCGADGRQPFQPEEEAFLLLHLRKRQLWPCFESSKVQYGSKGFRALGFHERLKMNETNRKASTRRSLSVERHKKNAKQGVIPVFAISRAPSSQPGTGRARSLSTSGHALTTTKRPRFSPPVQDQHCLKRQDCNREDVSRQFRCLEEGAHANFAMPSSSATSVSASQWTPNGMVLDYSEDGEMFLFFPEPHQEHLLALEEFGDANAASSKSFFLSSVSDDEDIHSPPANCLLPLL